MLRAIWTSLPTNTHTLNQNQLRVSSWNGILFFHVYSYNVENAMCECRCLYTWPLYQTWSTLTFSPLNSKILSTRGKKILETDVLVSLVSFSCRCHLVSLCQRLGAVCQVFIVVTVPCFRGRTGSFPCVLCERIICSYTCVAHVRYDYPDDSRIWPWQHSLPPFSCCNKYLLISLFSLFPVFESRGLDEDCRHRQRRNLLFSAQYLIDCVWWTHVVPG